ncbi:MFS transporter, NNP family, nitrate/nitrite transporter [Thalassobacillus cyri]|uniref:MFS transporter, NNP family, nitrate/nitrite transporter n=1 Tax=Thalassobacillus cyri TaxID=571932 RepID=A0A1H4EHB9_9BACI|nr:nitrate/nitrite transporter [Thalassobacillus cyri]SEA84474.1 MFS transporter, NNP family, nitrate/nitrite transporter [Thalassobacillus cyri]
MKSKIQLPLQTMNLVTGFMVWVLISSLLPFITEDIAIAPEQIAWVTAIPVILGSVLRIPLGYLANLLGARLIFMVSFILLLFPVYYISVADSLIDLLIGGLFLGIGGAIFSVGVTSLPKYYDKSRHGFVNGIYGAGNIGTAITAFAAPVVAANFGWSFTVQLYLVLLGIFILLNFFFGDKKETRVKVPLMQQIKGVYKNEKLWLFCLFYFITFGSFVAFTVYLPNFLVANFGLDKVDAGMRTAGFIAVATFLRPLGGWLADRFHSLILLMYVFGGFTVAALLLSFAPSINLYTVGSLTIAVAAGIGNGIIFKLVPMYFNKQAGIANGIVSAMGGLGGFFPPLILSLLYSWTGHYAIGFMALSQIALASLILVIWMYYHDKLAVSHQIMETTPLGMMVTDKNGKIVTVNPAFTKLTGFEAGEVEGKNPNILKSGRQSPAFYQRMWDTLETNGYWQGEIWNKRKDGKHYLEWLTINAIKDDSGEIIQYAGVFTDITEKQQQKSI